MARVRGKTAERGYDHHHQQERAALAPLVAAGQATCWRCQRPIVPGSPWDLGHDDHDRRITIGPEHQHCNRAAGARKLNAMRRARGQNRQRLTTWEVR